MLSTIDDFFETHQINLKNKIWIGFSGGEDSSALLHILANQYSLNLHAIHINHNLDPNSKAWQQHCETFCQNLQIPITTKSVIITPPYKQGLEATARLLRYQAFDEITQKQGVILLAHHQLDQAETCLQRLFKGHGNLGLAGIPAIRNHGTLIIGRPLLSTPKTEIIKYCQTNNIKYIHDPSNNLSKFERNWIRNEIIPIINNRIPQAIKCINKSQHKIRNSQILLNDLAAIDLSTIQINIFTINIKAFNQLTQLRKINCLKYWIRSNQLTPPAETKLITLITQLKTIKPNKHPECIWNNKQLKAYNNQLILETTNSTFNIPDKPINLEFNSNNTFKLPLGYLTTQQTIKTIQLQYSYPTTLNQKFNLINKPQAIQLKHLLHKANIAPWHRNQYPLIMYNNIVIYLPNIGPIKNYNYNLKIYWNINKIN